MTVLRPADPGQVADLAAFLGRLVRWDRAAVVRLRSAPVAGGGGAAGVFGRPPFGDVLAVRVYRLADGDSADVTVSAGQLLDGLDERAGRIVVPAGVTGPAWAGMLPPRDGWERLAEPDPRELRAAAGAVIAEFRARSEALPAAQRTRERMDALAEEIWTRPLPGTRLPLRAVHAAHALGFLRPVPAVVGAGAGGGPDPEPGETVVLARGPWLRLSTPCGSVAVRRAAPSLSVSPL